jgi:hypothetical protein
MAKQSVFKPKGSFQIQLKPIRPSTNLSSVKQLKTVKFDSVTERLDQTASKFEKTPFDKMPGVSDLELGSVMVSSETHNPLITVPTNNLIKKP